MAQILLWVRNFLWFTLCMFMFSLTSGLLRQSTDTERSTSVITSNMWESKGPWIMRSWTNKINSYEMLLRTVTN